jgi:hypothetical protein
MNSKKRVAKKESGTKLPLRTSILSVMTNVAGTLPITQPVGLYTMQNKTTIVWVGPTSAITPTS